MSDEKQKKLKKVLLSQRNRAMPRNFVSTR